MTDRDQRMAGHRPLWLTAGLPGMPGRDMAECKTAEQYSHAAGGRRCVCYILCLFSVCACRQVCLSVYMGVGMCAHARVEAREQLLAIIPQKPATLSLGCHARLAGQKDPEGSVSTPRSPSCNSEMTVDAWLFTGVLRNGLAYMTSSLPTS